LEISYRQVNVIPVSFRLTRPEVLDYFCLGQK
uniref:Transcriptional regulator n=1 Tax=Brugia timori TaxID=42155 RepID=A0A0R3QFA1_9BILA